MAKGSTSKAAQPPATAAKKRPADEIDAMFDDLFASKKSKANSAPSAASVAQPAPLEGKKKQNKGKGKALPQQYEGSSSESDEDDEMEMDDEQPSDMMDVEQAVRAAKAKRAPVTIVDPSAQIEAFRNAPPAPAAGRKRGEKEAEIEERFMDSRGTREYLSSAFSRHR